MSNKVRGATFNATLARTHLKNFEFNKLFTQVLGWNQPRTRHDMVVRVGGTEHRLHHVAEKEGFQVLVHDAGDKSRPDDLPAHDARRAIDREVTELAHEHLIIFIDPNKTTQIWQWVRRKHGETTRSREFRYASHQTGEALLARLRLFTFTLDDEEEGVTLPGVLERVEEGLNVEPVTRRFYSQFRDAHDKFLTLLQGITDKGQREWYTSVMLNRIMFIYFIQTKGFLNNDTAYLRNKLTASAQTFGPDHFYKDFLSKLFFKGFAIEKKDRSPQINALLGQVPYLNGGLFAEHTIEKEHGAQIDIPDQAFQQIFDFFDGWSWVLDDRPTRAGNEINPDVLGYIFEKYINQKQMGAYYTKEDITEYICRNTIVPWLLDFVRGKMEKAFDANADIRVQLGQMAAPTEDTSVWRLLRDDPDAYIYPAMQKGCKLPLPDEIAQGIADVSKRGGWNRPADPEYALPTEIWREVVARRQRYEEVRGKIERGEVHTINDLITYNLKLREFAENIIVTCEDSTILKHIWDGLTRVTVLDPTCGSGAFLFAALNILFPLYNETLTRMGFLVVQDPNAPYVSEFKRILEEVTKHPNRSYFILKQIVVRNLYGVDIMEEATEIAKLRLFLKLVAQVDSVEKIEPLPDIDFNIRAGNTLVGYVNGASVQQAMERESSGQAKMVFGEEKGEYERFEYNLKEVDRAFRDFQELQRAGTAPVEVVRAAKETLQTKLGTVRERADKLLANQYNVGLSGAKWEVAYPAWKKSHEPFHWFVEFYGIIERGGFDVIVGNPPYVEYKNVRKTYTINGFACATCGDLYAFTMERSKLLLNVRGRLGMIVPISITSTDKFSPLRQLMGKRMVSWSSSYAHRPTKLFEGVEKRLTIWLAARRNDSTIYSSRFHHWYQEERDTLLDRIAYVETTEIPYMVGDSIPKVESTVARDILGKMKAENPLEVQISDSEDFHIYYTRKFGYFLNFLDFIPRITDQNRKLLLPSELKSLTMSSNRLRYVVLAALNSSLFFWFVKLHSDARNLNKRDIEQFRLTTSAIAPDLQKSLEAEGNRLCRSLDENSITLTNTYANGSSLQLQSFLPKESKFIVDDIDRLLARHYGFTDEELDYIINYDIKYRMGDALGGEEE